MSKVVVTFRMQPEALRDLKSEARRVGLKPANWIEETVLERLSDVEAESREEDLAELRHQVELLRSELAIATEGILVVTGSQKPYSPEKAREFVDRNLKTKGKD